MTKEKYLKEYRWMTSVDYGKMKKGTLLQIMAEFSEGLKNGIQEYDRPNGDVWTVEDEIEIWYRFNFNQKDGIAFTRLVDKDENGFAIDNGILCHSKKWMILYLIVLDMAYASMNNVVHKHRLYDITF